MNKTFVLAGAMCACIVCSSRADIVVSWESPANTFYKSNGTTLLPAGSLFLTYWSTDVTMGFNPAAPTAPLGGDVFLDARNTSLGPAIPGRITDPTVKPQYAGVGSGYVYLAVFDMLYSSYSGPESIAVGTKYQVAPVTPTAVTGFTPPATPPPPTPVNYLSQTYSTTLQVIPEPGTGMLLLSGLGLFFARRLRRQV